MVTRFNNYLCTPSDGINGSKPSSKRQFLSFFLHLQINIGNTIKDSANTEINHEFWEKASISIIRKGTAILKVERLHNIITV